MNNWTFNIFISTMQRFFWRRRNWAQWCVCEGDSRQETAGIHAHAMRNTTEHMQCRFTDTQAAAAACWWTARAGGGQLQLSYPFVHFYSLRVASRAANLSSKTLQSRENNAIVIIMALRCLWWVITSEVSACNGADNASSYRRVAASQPYIWCNAMTTQKQGI